jgi:hypothetical protein
MTPPGAPIPAGTLAILVFLFVAFARARLARDGRPL